MHLSFRKHSLLLLLLAGLGACKKNDQQPPAKPTTDTTSTPGPVRPIDTVKPASTEFLYIECGIVYQKINVTDSSLVWENGNGNLTGSAGSPMLLDSTGFYTGSTRAVYGYSKNNGNRLWSFSWLLPSGGSSYIESVILDSLVFFTSPSYEYMTSVPAMLHCLNKNTGDLKWSNKVDSIYEGSGFNTTPVVATDKVIAVTTDKNSHKYLTAYRISDGATVWSTAVNNYVFDRPKGENGQVYLLEGPTIYCYNATDGSLQWQARAQDQGWGGKVMFFEKGQLILVTLSFPRLDVNIFNTTNGALLSYGNVQVSTGSTNPEYSGMACIYSNNKLIVTSRFNDNFVYASCFDLLKQKRSWQKAFKDNVNPSRVMSAPIYANNHIIFPTLTPLMGEKYQGHMHFLNLDGEEIKSIPFVTDISLTRFAYEEKGVNYNQVSSPLRRI